MVRPIFYFTNYQNSYRSILKFNSALVLLIIIGFIGLRDPFGNWRYFGDSYRYTLDFLDLYNGYLFEDIKDYGFYFFTKFISQTGSLGFYYLLCALIYVMLPYKAYKKWLNYNAFYVLLLHVTSISFWGFGINGIRNGLAVSILLFSFSFADKKKLFYYALIIIAISFHKSVILPAFVFLFFRRYNNTGILIKIWLFAVVFSFLFGSRLNDFFENNINLFNLIDERGNTYFSGKVDDVKLATNFRFDFIIYSGLPILLGYICVIKKGFNDVFYTSILNTYIITNIFWVLMIYAAYTNRIAYLSWFLMPLVMIYPLLKSKLFKNQKYLIGYLVFGSLFFTLILEFL